MNPFDTRRQKFCELITLMNRLYDANKREMKNYKKITDKNGNTRYIPKVYAKDDEF